MSATPSVADVLDSFQCVGHSILYPGTGYDIGNVRRDYGVARACDLVPCRDVGDEWFHYRCGFLVFVRNAGDGGFAVKPESVSRLFANVWFGGGGGTGTGTFRLVEGISSTDVRDYQGVVSSGVVTHASIALVRYLACLYVIAHREPGSGTKIDLGRALYHGPDRLLREPVVSLNYGVMCRNIVKKIGPGISPSERCDIHWIHPLDVGAEVVYVHDEQPGSQYVFDGMKRASGPKRRRVAAEGVESAPPLPPPPPPDAARPFRVCRSCFRDTCGARPSGWLGLGLVRPLFDAKFVEDSLGVFSRPDFRSVMVGSVVWTVLKATGVGAGRRTCERYAELGDGFCSAPALQLVRLWRLRNEGCVALSAMFGPVVWHLGKTLGLSQFDGMGARGIGWYGELDYFGWTVRKPCDGKYTAPPYVVGAGPDMLQHGAFGYDADVPQRVYQTIVLTHKTSAGRVVIETAAYLSWVHIVAGGAMIEMVCCAEDDDTVDGVDGRCDFRPDITTTRLVRDIPRGGRWENNTPDVVTVHHAECLDWSGVLWLLTRPGCPRLVLRGSYQRALKGVWCARRHRMVGGVFSELVTIINFCTKEHLIGSVSNGCTNPNLIGSVRHGDEFDRSMPQTLIIANRGIEHKPLSVDIDVVCRYDAETAILDAGVLDVAAVNADRLELFSAWRGREERTFLDILGLASAVRLPAMLESGAAARKIVMPRAKFFESLRPRVPGL
jgi:hypothetical protein